MNKQLTPPTLGTYKAASHLTPWYKFGSLLTLQDELENPYGFSNNPIDARDISYRLAKLVASQYCQYFADN